MTSILGNLKSYFFPVLGLPIVVMKILADYKWRVQKLFLLNLKKIISTKLVQNYMWKQACMFKSNW